MHVDSGPSASSGSETHVVMPEIPEKLRRQRSQTSTAVVVHVDRSGWICAAAIAESSGEPSWDQAALKAVTLWRLKPAVLRGEAVESLMLTTLTSLGRK